MAQHHRTTTKPPPHGVAVLNDRALWVWFNEQFECACDMASLSIPPGEPKFRLGSVRFDYGMHVSFKGLAIFDSDWVNEAYKQMQRGIQRIHACRREVRVKSNGTAFAIPNGMEKLMERTRTIRDVRENIARIERNIARWPTTPILTGSDCEIVAEPADGHYCIDCQKAAQAASSSSSAAGGTTSQPTTSTPTTAPESAPCHLADGSALTSSDNISGGGVGPGLSDVPYASFDGVSWYPLTTTYKQTFVADGSCFATDPNSKNCTALLQWNGEEGWVGPVTPSLPGGGNSELSLIGCQWYTTAGGTSTGLLVKSHDSAYPTGDYTEEPCDVGGYGATNIVLSH